MSIDIWNGAAPAWDRHATFVDDHTDQVTERMLSRAGVREGQSVLDLAAGPGGAGLAAAPLVGATGRVVLTDGAPEMVAIARRRAVAHPQVSAEVVDLDDIQLPPGSFNVALCRHGLMFVADVVPVLRGIAAMLRPGGVLAAATWDRRVVNPWLGLLLDAVGAQFGVPFPPPQLPGPFSLDDADELQWCFAEAGFADVRVEAVPTPFRMDTLEEWWTRVPELAGPLAQALAGMDPPVVDAIRRRAIGAAQAVAAEVDGGFELAGSALVTVGRVG